MSRVIYRVCRHYVDSYLGENNSDIRRNGESWWLSRTLSTCRVVFDVGANVGDWAQLALSMNPALEIHCFEPSAATFRRLQARQLVGREVILNHIGLGEAAGDATLHVYSPAAGANSLYRREGLYSLPTTTEPVKLESLDTYCVEGQIRQIDLLKLDVEGHELCVLKGATQLLASGSIRRIQFEYGGTYIDARVLLKDVFELLTLYRYRLHKLYPRHLQFFDQYDQRLETFQYQNWVALAADGSSCH